MPNEKRRPTAPELERGHSHPEKARHYRATFQDAHGHSWNEHITAWRKQHPEYRERAKLHAAKSRLIARLGLRQRLAAWGLPPEQVSPVLRRVPVEQINCIVDCLQDWDRLTGQARRTGRNLVHLLHARRVFSNSRVSAGPQPTTGGKTQ